MPPVAEPEWRVADGVAELTAGLAVLGVELFVRWLDADAALLLVAWLVPPPPPPMALVVVVAFDDELFDDEFELATLSPRLFVMPKNNESRLETNNKQEEKQHLHNDKRGMFSFVMFLFFCVFDLYCYVLHTYISKLFLDTNFPFIPFLCAGWNGICTSVILV